MVIQDFFQATAKLVELLRNGWVFRCFAAIHGKSCIAFILGMISNFQQQTTNQTTNQQPTAVKRQQKQSIFCKILRLGVKANPQKCGALHVALWRPLARWSKTGLSVIGLSGENWKNWGKQVTYPRGAKISCFLFEMFKVMFYGLLSMVNHGLCCNHLKQI